MQAKGRRRLPHLACKHVNNLVNGRWQPCIAAVGNLATWQPLHPIPRPISIGSTSSQPGVKWQANMQERKPAVVMVL